MLFVEAKFKSGLAIGIERKKVEVVVGAAIEHASAGVNSSVDERGRRAGVFGLDVILVTADGDVGVVTENHR